ncbi:MAG: DUF3168 domain-containing protein [Candidatus Devosia phytovorans]|uniref:DUF3168 domain-containing protein n=1 Tax=Candidatus Devosia phytovorans TaxID=3121372 RepID=A0AAJ5VSW5_9HYPH|nr:DUF3168 domain-containing protein [Devosia sp.]WEK02779.1 MAG: DUF3168 domain-containing protein [Devosia sp.]
MQAIALLQGALVMALRADAELVALVGAEGVFDAVPKGRAAPYVVIARHDGIARDGDLAPVLEHRLLIHCWSDQPSRKRALDMAERVAAVAESFVATGIVVTHRDHLRTETMIDRNSGLARAAVTLRFFSEPI